VKTVVRRRTVLTAYETPGKLRLRGHEGFSVASEGAALLRPLRLRFEWLAGFVRGIAAFPASFYTFGVLFKTPCKGNFLSLAIAIVGVFWMN